MDDQMGSVERRQEIASKHFRHQRMIRAAPGAARSDAKEAVFGPTPKYIGSYRPFRKPTSLDRGQRLIQIGHQIVRVLKPNRHT